MATKEKHEVKIKGFQPSKDGFQFPNSFPGAPLPEALTKLIDVSKSRYGLCGGMVFSTIDFNRAKKHPPKVDKIPERETSLYDYISKRQLQSWGTLSSQVLRYVKWMGYSDEKAQTETLESWQELKKALDKDDLTVLGLIYHDFEESLKVWDNHQVLAYGYTEEPDGSINIYLYDPNFPKNDDIYIKAKPIEVQEGKKKVPGLFVEQYWGKNKIKNMHGFMLIPYEPADPPDNLR